MNTETVTKTEAEPKPEPETEPESETEKMTDAEKLLFHQNACQMWNTCINNWNTYKKNYTTLYGNDRYRHYYISKPIIFPYDENDEDDE